MSCVLVSYIRIKYKLFIKYKRIQNSWYMYVYFVHNLFPICITVFLVVRVKHFLNSYRPKNQIYRLNWSITCHICYSVFSRRTVSLTTRTLCRYFHVWIHYSTVKFLGCFEITALNFKMKRFF